MNDFADRLKAPVSLSTNRHWRRRAPGFVTTVPGRPPVTDGPFAETKDLIAGWMMIDVDSYDRALELAGELLGGAGRRRQADPRVARVAAVLRSRAHSHRIATGQDDLVLTKRCCGS